MTAQRKDNHSTEFGLWLRQQECIDSKLGYVATNIDYMWTNYKTKEWMIIEEKRYGTEPVYFQRQMFRTLSASIEDSDFRGFHLLIFENTSPDDGGIKLNGKSITKDELIQFLKFELKTNPRF